MVGNFNVKKLYKYPAILTGIAVALMLSVCASKDVQVKKEPAANMPVTEKSAAKNHNVKNPEISQPPPQLIVNSPQEAIYNGYPHPLSYQYTGNEKPDVVYFLSPESRGRKTGGSSRAPVNAGAYYAAVRSPYEEVHAELFIHKQTVKIESDKHQNAIYNGSPKRISAKSEPPVSLSYFYYPSREFMETAIRMAEESSQEETPSLPSAEFRGYRRIDRAPSEQGTYFVWVYFPGDENHLSASAHIEFTILPPW